MTSQLRYYQHIKLKDLNRIPQSLLKKTQQVVTFK